MYSGRIVARLPGNQARERKGIFKWGNQKKKKKGGSRWNVLTDQDGEEESFKQPVVFTGRPKMGAGKVRGVFNGPIEEAGVGRGVVQMLYSPRLSEAPGGSPPWTVGCKVAHSLINKVKFVSRRRFWSKSWRRGQNLPESTSLEMHAEGLGTSQLSPRPFCTGVPHPRPVFEHPHSLAKGPLGGRREGRTESPRELFHENQPHNFSAEQRTLHTIALTFFLM